MDPLSYLFGLEPIGIKFGLENIEALVASLGHPERAYKTIHIAGTNGKGSVTAIVDTALAAAGHRSARYTSPHLVDIRERFVIAGQLVGADALDRAIVDVRAHIDALRAAGKLSVQPTFFEVTTAIAFELFKRAGVDVAVIEVGLGGRLDATNVVSPEATAITSIAFDHEQYLGHSLRAIAGEKAGTIKRGVPVVVGAVTADAEEAIERVARERGAPIVRAWDGVTVGRASSAPTRFMLRTPANDYGAVELALAGAHQIGNAVVAVRLLELIGVPAAAIVEGLARVSWPGRLELRRFPDGRELLLDAAHNPAGAAALASYLHESGDERPALVFSAMRDKDLDAVLRALLPAVGAVVVTRASNSRAADPSELAERVRAIEPALPVIVAPAPRDAVAAAWTLRPRIVVAGSIFLLGDVLRVIDEASSAP